jgi:hypothetical protein
MRRRKTPAAAQKDATRAASKVLADKALKEASKALSDVSQAVKPVKPAPKATSKAEVDDDMAKLQELKAKYPEMFAQAEGKTEPAPMRTEYEKTADNKDVLPGDPNFHYCIVPSIDERGNRRSPVQTYLDMGYVVVKTDPGYLACSSDVLMAIPNDIWERRLKEVSAVHNDPMGVGVTEEGGLENKMTIGKGSSLDKLAEALPSSR